MCSEMASTSARPYRHSCVPLPWCTSQSMMATRSSPRADRGVRRQGRVREQAVAVRGGRLRVVAGRADERVGLRALAVQHGPGRLQRRAGRRQRRGPRALAHPGAPGQHAAAAQAELAHLLDVRRVVQMHQLVDLGMPAVPPAQPAGDRPVAQRRADVADPHVVLGMQLGDLDQRRRVVLEHAAAGVVQQHVVVPEHIEGRVGHGRGAYMDCGTATRPATILRTISSRLLLIDSAEHVHADDVGVAVVVEHRGDVAAAGAHVVVVPAHLVAGHGRAAGRPAKHIMPGAPRRPHRVRHPLEDDVDEAGEVLVPPDVAELPVAARRAAVLYWFCGPISPVDRRGSQVGHQTVIADLVGPVLPVGRPPLGAARRGRRRGEALPRLSCRRCNPRGTPPAL